MWHITYVFLMRPAGKVTYDDSSSGSQQRYKEREIHVMEVL